MYAILSHGGRQYRVSAGDRLVVDRLQAEVGSVIALEPVLLTGGDGTTEHGAALDGVRVAAIVVGHKRGEKLRIFKYKAKKRSRKMAGHRSELTELRVDSILAKGAAVPKPVAAAAPAAAPVKAAPTRRSTPAAAAPRTATPPPGTADGGEPDAVEAAATTTKAKAGKAVATRKTTTPPPATGPKPAPKRRAAVKKDSGDGS
jgi:large subunit ribosomal protein L21